VPQRLIWKSTGPDRSHRKGIILDPFSGSMSELIGEPERDTIFVPDMHKLQPAEALRFAQIVLSCCGSEVGPRRDPNWRKNSLVETKSQKRSPEDCTKE
jgi:hypothetical protein